MFFSEIRQNVTDKPDTQKMVKIDVFYIKTVNFDYFHGDWIGGFDTSCQPVLSVVVQCGPVVSKLAKVSKTPYQSLWKSRKSVKNHCFFVFFRVFRGFVRKFTVHKVWLGFWKLKIQKITKNHHFFVIFLTFS